VRGGAQIIRICTAAGLPGLDRAAAHNGGYRMSRDHAAITVCDDGPA
jgi:hypothetical protein